jgi:[acyl-carrier-protein] S-malonyltransferase
MALAKDAGAKRAVMLPMSAPSHCSLMRPAAERLREKLAQIEIAKPSIPVLHNLLRRGVRRSRADPRRLDRAARPPGALDRDHRIPGAHGDRPRGRVRPGKVLTGLSRRIAADVEYLALNDSAALEAALR